MSFGNAPGATPALPPATPMPQPDDPSLIDTQREMSIKQRQSQGFEASLLTPGKQNSSTPGMTKTQTLGYGS